MSVTFATQDLLDDLRARFPLNVSSEAQEQLQLRAEEWALRTQLELASERPFVSHERECQIWIDKIGRGEASEEEYLAATTRFGEFCQLAGRPFDLDFWQQQVKGDDPSHHGNVQLEREQHLKLRTAVGLLGIKWRETLDRAQSEWELEEIFRRREILRKELETLLTLIQTLKFRLEGLGLELGILMDLSKGMLSSQDIEQVQRWVEYLANDEGVKALCDLLGKLRQIELSERVEQAKVIHTQDVWQPDPTSREEIVGVRLGRDLEHALPSELALLADPDASILFDMKYVESRLMCFDMRGMQLVGEQREGQAQRSISEEDQMGPMVICIDTSGSMHGMPETIAKAVALYMVAKAREQNRACYLINFSTGINVLDFSLEGSIEALIRFLQMSFHGGTDATPALRHALDTMQRDQYARADMLVISDFVMGAVSESVRCAIEAQRTYGNRFYSLVIDGGFHLQDFSVLFDQEWVYDPRHSRITELVDFQKRVAACTRELRATV